MSVLLRGKVRQLIDALIQWILRSSIKQKDFCIISNDCWGGELYKRMHIPYNTPFVGLMIMAPCYLKLLRNLKYYLNAELKFIPKSKYPAINKLRNSGPRFPIGMLNDVEIHFLHYESEKEAKAKWTRRKQRMNWDKLFIKFNLHKDYARVKHLQSFDLLPYTRKICFCKTENKNYKSCIKIKDFDLNALFLFRNTMREFDIASWINNGNPQLKGISMIRGLLLYYLLKL